MKRFLSEEYMNKKLAYYLYVLALEDGFVYVGVTCNLKKRFLEHRKGLSATTRMKKPKYVMEAYSLGEMTYHEACRYENATCEALSRSFGYKCLGGDYVKVNKKREMHTELDGKYFSSLEPVDVSQFERCFSVCKKKKKRAKNAGNPWALQEKRARKELRASARRFY